MCLPLSFESSARVPCVSLGLHHVSCKECLPTTIVLSDSLQGFNVKGTLERHMFVHTKKKEYKCAICKLAFTQSNNLKRHIALHTGK